MESLLGVFSLEWSLEDAGVELGSRKETLDHMEGWLPRPSVVLRVRGAVWWKGSPRSNTC